MVRAEKYIRFSQVTEGFLGASLQFEEGIEKTVMWYLFSKITPSLFTLKEGSTAFPKPLSPQGTGDATALRCSEPLRYRVGGASKPSPGCAGWDRLANEKGTSASIAVQYRLTHQHTKRYLLHIPYLQVCTKINHFF